MSTVLTPPNQPPPSQPPPSQQPPGQPPAAGRPFPSGGSFPAGAPRGTAPQSPGSPDRRAAPVWWAAAAVAFAVLAAASGLSGVFEGRLWFDNTVVTVCAVLAAGAAVRVPGIRAGWPAGRGAVLAAPAQLVALALVLTLQFFPSTAVLGIIPTAETVQQAMEQFPLANAAILAQAQPVLAETPLYFLVCLAVGVVAIITDTLAFGLRFPAVSAVPLAVVLAAASLVKPAGAGLIHVAAAALGYLLVLGAARLARGGPDPRAGLRSGVVRQAVLIAAASLAVMMAVPLAIPGFTSGLLPEGQRLYLWGRPSGINPVLNLGSNLRERIGLTNVTYFTDDPEPLYLRTAVIADLDDDRWAPSDTDADRSRANGDLVQENVDTLAAASTTATTRIITGNYQSPWLPVPRGAQGISGLDGGWGWNPDTSTILSRGGSSSLDRDYRVVSQRPTLTPGLLEASSRITEANPTLLEAVVPETYRSVPSELPEIITSTARAIVDDAGADTAFDQALALQNTLRGPGYTYSEQTPLEQGYDGNGLAVVEAFLQQKSGYCTHYSAAMALMARSLGIPSRIAVGYAPGRSDGRTVEGPGSSTLEGHEVSARDAHAWPELYFANIGWVPFEPTPGRGSTPDYAPDAAAGPAAPTDDPLRPSAGRTDAPASESAEPSSAPAAAPEGGPTDDAGSRIPAQLAGALLVLALLMGPYSMRRWARRRRLRRVLRATEDDGGDWRDGPRAAWEELVALGTDYGLPMERSETATGYTARLGRHIPDAAASLELLRERYELVQYSQARQLGPQLVPRGPSSGIHRTTRTREVPIATALLAAVGDVEQELSSAATPGAQARARAVPASLFNR